MDRQKREAAALGAKQAADAEAARKRAEAADLTRPGRVFRDCPDVCPEMVVIPAGEFMMGSTATEIAALKKQDPDQAHWYDAEGPQKKS